MDDKNRLMHHGSGGNLVSMHQIYGLSHVGVGLPKATVMEATYFLRIDLYENFCKDGRGQGSYSFC